jgi:hypothetical protein
MGIIVVPTIGWRKMIPRTVETKRHIFGEGKETDFQNSKFRRI